MNQTRFISLVLLIGAVLITATAQSPRRRTTPRAPTAKPTPAATPANKTSTAQPSLTPRTELAPTAVAVVNDVTISAADIEDQVNAAILRDPDPYLRAYYLDPEKETREARQRALDVRINSLLIASEAKKRGKSSDEILQTEINSRIAPPTEQEIKATYDANRDQIGTADLESVRPDLINFIRNQRSQELYAALISRLKMTNAVNKHVDVNAANLAPGAVLAAVNGEPLRVETINERTKAYVYKLEMRIYAVRKGILDRRINDLLIVAEASKRKVGPEEIVRVEITDKIKTPTEAEVARFYEENKVRLGTTPNIKSIREVETDQISFLEMPVGVKGVIEVSSVYGSSYSDRQESYYAFEFTDRSGTAYLYMERNQAGQDLRGRILAAGGQIEGFFAFIIRRDRFKTTARTIYAELLPSLPSGLASFRTEIAKYLEQQQQERLEIALADKLRAGAKVQVLLKEPDPPLLNVGLANGASRGDPNAAVTVIEFTDFQCSSCGAMYPVVEDVLKSYGNRVRFVIRNFPLTRAHANAFHAAQAAEAAKAQGKFWEYIDFLFKNQTSLDDDSLKKFATQVGLDRKRFDVELEVGKYDSIIRRDLEDGEIYGVEATPTFFINGAVLTDYSADGVRTAIEKAFARAGKRP